MSWCPVYQVLCEPEAQAPQHTPQVLVRVADADKCVGSVEVVPVLEVGSWLEELGGEGEAHGSKVGHAYESAVGGLVMHSRGYSGVIWDTKGYAYFRSMPSSVLNLELSTGAFSAPALDGVPARDGSFELSAEEGVDPGRAFSAVSWSAILLSSSSSAGGKMVQG